VNVVDPVSEKKWNTYEKEFIKWLEATIKLYEDKVKDLKKIRDQMDKLN